MSHSVLLLRPRDRGHIFAASAILAADALVTVVTDSINAGGYELTASATGLANAEAAFDHFNMGDDSVYMGPGDVLVWLDGRRELCLPNGWRMI